jgi:hypothetical protein
MTAGNLIIIGLDANDNARRGPVNAMLRSRGLVEVHHCTQHSHLPPRVTCNKNTQDTPVDGIWAPPSLDGSSSGYLRFLSGKCLLKARAKERNATVETQATQLKNTFGQRKFAQRVKRLTGKQRGAPLRSVNAPAGNSNTNWVECTNKLSIKQAFACEGTQRFSQTNGTPLVQTDFVQRVDYLADLPGAAEILNGTFVPKPGLDPYAVQFLSHLKMETAVSNQPPISKVISTQSYQDSWKKMKPNTSSSPVGPTFVHYIAGSRDQLIAGFYAAMANISYASRYSPAEVWIKMVDVLIPKKTKSSAMKNSVSLSCSTLFSI